MSGWLESSIPRVAKFFGVTRRVIAEDWRSRGMPEKTEAGYDLAAIARWRIQYERAQKTPDDLLMDGPASPALERYREERANLAALDRQEREGELFRIEILRPKMDAMAALIRGAADRLQRECGPEAYEILIDALNDFDKALEDMPG